jgi:hypothetical protein
MTESLNQDQVGIVFVSILVLLVVGPLLFPLVLMLFRREGTGFIRVAREQVYGTGDVDQLWATFVERLQYEGFVVDRQAAPNKLFARREHVTLNQSSPTKSTGHALKPYDVIMLFVPEGPTTRMLFSLQIRDFVLFDTGEKRYMNELTDRLLAADLAKSARPVVLNPSYCINYALCFAALMCVGSLAILIPPFTSSMTVGLLIGYAMTVPVLGALAIIGFLQAKWHPNEVTGAKRVPAVFALLLLSLALASGLAWMRHGPTLKVFWRDQMEVARQNRAKAREAQSQDSQN